MDSSRHTTSLWKTRHTMLQRQEKRLRFKARIFCLYYIMSSELVLHDDCKKIIVQNETFMIGFFHVLFCLGKFIWWSEKPDLQYLARTPHSVRSSREAGPAYLSVELDSEDVVGVTVVADLRPLLEMVDVHALRHSGAHHNYQTAGEKTLHDVNIRSFCRGQRTAGDQYLVSVPTGPHKIQWKY